MTASAPIPSAPDDRGAVFEAVADALATAETYAATGARFAEIRDAQGLAYSIRCAAACLETAAGLTAELRPSPTRGGQAA